MTVYQVIVKDEDGQGVELPEVKEPFAFRNNAEGAKFIIESFGNLPSGWTVEVVPYGTRGS